MIYIGNSSQGRLASKTMGRCGVACAPPISSPRITRTTVNNTGNTNPLFPLAISVNGNNVERSKKHCIDPDCHLPPCRSRQQHRVECPSPPVNSIDGERRWPDGIGEMCRVGNNQLFDIDNVGDEQDVNEEKSENSDIPRSFRQRNNLLVHMSHCSTPSSSSRHCQKSRRQQRREPLLPRPGVSKATTWCLRSDTGSQQSPPVPLPRQYRL